MFERQHVQKVIELATVSSNMRIIALTGPRQVGKTTIALQSCVRLSKLGFLSWYYSADTSSPVESNQTKWMRESPVQMGTLSDGLSLVDTWKNARLASLQSDRGLVLFLDEIQLIRGWSNIVKGLWDADRREGYPLRAVILGSAAWKMLVGRNESLAGRFTSLPTSHWTLREMTQVFGLTPEEYIFFGGYPGILSGRPDPAEVTDWQRYILDSILKPVTDRDIMGLEHTIRKPALMRQLVDLAPHYSGQIIAYNKLLGQLQDAGNTTTLARYVDLLSDVGILTALSRYTPKPHLGKASPPKLNVLNTALMTAKSGYSFEEAQADRSFWGRILESAVGAHLYNTRGPATRIHFWRDPSYEVDYVIARGPHLVGIEVKSGKSTTYRGLDAFKNRFPHAKTVIAGSKGIPISEFLSLTTEEWLEEL